MGRREEYLHYAGSAVKGTGKAAAFTYKNIIRPTTIFTVNALGKTAIFLHHNGVKPATKALKGHLDKPSPGFSRNRRGFLLWTAASMAAGAGGLAYVQKSLQEDRPIFPCPPTQEPTKIPQPPEIMTAHEALGRPEVIRFNEPFDGKEANKIAKELGITVETFLNLDKAESFYPKLQAISKVKTLLPIYPPAVMEYKELLYQLAEKYQVPVNYLATIVSIESAGYANAGSDAGAKGLFQVMDYNYKGNGVIAKPDQYKDPNLNGEAGIRHFLNNWDEVMKIYTNYNSPAGKLAKVFFRSLLAYNSGYAGQNEEFESLPAETKWYFENAFRYALTAEVAQRLKDQGMVDSDIVKSLVSSEINSRMETYKGYKKTIRTNVQSLVDKGLVKDGEEKREAFYIEYKKAMQTLSVNNLSQQNSELGTIYLANLSKPLPKKFFAPGLSIWLGIPDDTSLYFITPANKRLAEKNLDLWDSQDWEALATADTRRNKLSQRTPNNTIIFDQLDPAWEGDQNWRNWATCGPTTIAIILRRFGDKDATPASIDKLFQAKGLRAGRDAGTLFRSPDPRFNDVINWLRTEKNYEVIEVMDEKGKNKNVSLGEAKKYIDKGYLLVGSGRVPWHQGDQYILSDKVDHIYGINDIDLASNLALIFDPWRGQIRNRYLNPNETQYLYALKPRQS